MKKICIAAMVLTTLATSCKDGAEAEAQMPSTPAITWPIDTAYYKAFATMPIDYDMQNQASTAKEIAADKVLTTNKDIVSVRLQYRFATPNHFYTVAVYTDGNATALYSTERFKPSIVSSKDEPNVLAAAKQILALTEQNMSLFKPSAQAPTAVDDDVVFTITMKNGKYLSAKTSMKALDADSTALKPLFSSFDLASKAVNLNYEAATAAAAVK
jgi:hypothetical protein